MPSLANIVVKKNDGSTDVTYTGVVASSGDKTPAVWKNTAQGSAPAFNPVFNLTSRWSGNGGSETVRRLEASYVYPTTTVGSDGKTNLADKARMEVTWVLPQSMPQADMNEFVAQGINLLDSTLITDCVKSGYSAT
jgi:hypothetical protein